jgi:subtilisin family serine protease
MSFDYPNYSPELANAIKYANSNGVISVASAGNDGQRIAVSRCVAVGYRRCLYLQFRYSIGIHQLRRAPGLGGCSRRRGDDLSLGHLCWEMGHFVQCTFRQWNRCPHGRYQREMHQFQSRAWIDSRGVYFRSSIRIRTTGHVLGRASVPLMTSQSTSEYAVVGMNTYWLEITFREQQR